MTILIVEDEPVLARTLARALGELYHVIVEPSAEAARRRVSEAGIALVLLDRGLPDGDGVRVCAEMRASGVSVPIVILTGSDALSDQLAAYQAGADEYVTKPVDCDLLRHKIAAHLRPKDPQRLLRVGPMTVDFRLRRAAVDGVTVRLSPIECRILLALAEHLDQVLSVDHLAALVWGPDWKLERGSLYGYVSRMRAKLGRVAAAHLTNERSRGWMLRSRVP